MAAQEEKRKEFEARQQKIIEGVRAQDKVVAYKRSCRQYTEKILMDVATQLQQNPHDQNVQQFFDRSIEKINTLRSQKKEDDAQTNA